MGKRYAAFVFRHPWLILLCSLGVLGPAIWQASQLGLTTDLKDLLPKHRRSVTELDRINSRVGGNASFSIGIEGDDLPAMERFADDLAARLRALPPGLIDHVDESVRDLHDFFHKNRWLFASVNDLQELSDALEKKVIKETPLGGALDLDDAPAPTAAGPGTPAAGPPADDLKSLNERLKNKIAEFDRFPSGYYVGENNHLLAVYAYVPGGTDFDKAEKTLDVVRGVIADMKPANYHPSLRATVTGDLYVGKREYDAVKADVFLVSSLCVSLVLLSIVIFYGRLRSLFILGLALAVGVGVTFGFAHLTIGYLNQSTMFLGSIVAGNGINFGIVMLARYFEERRRGSAVETAVDIAIRKTAAGTAGAAGAASIAYGSLMLTDFRGFNQFGVIGGFGMLICWIAAYTVGPAAIVITEKVPFLARRSARQWKDIYVRPFVVVVRRYPRALVALGVVASIAGIVLSTLFIMRDPLEYNFSNLRNKERRQDYPSQLSGRIGRNVRTEGRDGVMFLLGRAEQVPLLKDALEKRKREQGPHTALGDVVSVEDILPDRQAEKLEILAHIRSVIDKSKDNLDDEDRKIALEHRPPPDLRPLVVKDIPKKILQPFMERDGTIGRVVYVAPAKWVEPWRGKDLMEYATAVESVTLADGETVYTSGGLVVLADMLRSVLSDGPIAVIASMGGVLLLIVIMMGRRLRASALTLFTVICGCGLMLGVASLFGMKLNFLNFVAIPITIGVGADYAVNMVRRYLDEPDLAAHEIVRTTGGAVTLCSMTTMIGYGALLVAANRALISFGQLAMLGEITCLTTAVAFFPALVRLLAKKPRVENSTPEEVSEIQHIQRTSVK